MRWFLKIFLVGMLRKEFNDRQLGIWEFFKNLKNGKGTSISSIKYLQIHPKIGTKKTVHLSEMSPIQTHLLPDSDDNELKIKRNIKNSAIIQMSFFITGTEAYFSLRKK
jgi:hypothetical protein